MIKLEAEHFTLIVGIWFMLMGYFWFDLFVVGVVICVISYAIDLIKRIDDSGECPFCGELPEILKKQGD